MAIAVHLSVVACSVRLDGRRSTCSDDEARGEGLRSWQYRRNLVVVEIFIDIIAGLFSVFSVGGAATTTTTTTTTTALCVVNHFLS
jgi:hypothetical protein